MLHKYTQEPFTAVREKISAIPFSFVVIIHETSVQARKRKVMDDVKRAILKRRHGAEEGASTAIRGGVTHTLV
uniref:AMP-binding_C domain-containing protein n=1 Tax=Panagrellus redivivus TaxID=6233 RepID=A0A7E4ZU43_PANRE